MSGGVAGPVSGSSLILHEPVRIQDRYLSGRTQIDGASLPKVCDRTAHGLDRDTKMVGYVVARDGQIDVRPGGAQPLGEHKQIGADLVESSRPTLDQ